MFSHNKLSRHILTTFYAPRGRHRIFELGIHIAQMYLSPADQIIGVIGEAGSGKSVLVKGYTHEAALLGVFAKVPSTVFNGVVAVIFAPILAVAIRNALKQNHLTLE